MDNCWIYFNGNGAEVDNDLGLMLQLVKCSPKVRLRLVTNRCGGTSLVYESRAYKLRYTGKRLKNWRLWRSEKRKGAKVD
ncbi:tRNA (uracil(54)-C(5))-methyltransferase [Trichinella spiralis]|uniref:tRNA (Uracil(54)-C(5))-methyltransferase n=1 Tax=Trichinella spiralis TaxID=6334 RepID=A0ABR3K2Y9_TRISP